ncbi:helix-turn-helix DNA binding protein [Gordonia phage Octobien14]|uniref:Helix-turn-helix DNA binding protein n=1 Tax=Gordonia phage Octobien14 TaxID=2483673 RepID=A0A3G3MB75_9CAUD|nr:helix-turn-helix DNA binding protein [Gordonia phage Octobien14]AYR03214.1 helix-turn-helix DNA binding protein [Gordonia phage Octobien14]
MSTGKTNSRRVLIGDRQAVEKRATIFASRGIPLTLDVDPIARHVNTLMDWGLPPNSIAAAAGVNVDTVFSVANGERESRVHLRVGRSLLAVGAKPVPAQEGHTVLAIGARRRLQALRRIGYNLKLLDELLESRDLAYRIEKQLTITYGIWMKVDALYRAKSHVAGPSSRAKIHAERQGWPDPFDWETANIDDPTSWPKELPKPESAQVTARRQGVALLGKGLSHKAVAAKVGVAERTVARWSTQMKEVNDGRNDPDSQSLGLVA